MFQLPKKKKKNLKVLIFLNIKNTVWEGHLFSKFNIKLQIFFWCIYYFFEPKPKSNLFFKIGIILVQKFQMPKRKKKILIFSYMGKFHNCDLKKKKKSFNESYQGFFR